LDLAKMTKRPGFWIVGTVVASAILLGVLLLAGDTAGDGETAADASGAAAGDVAEGDDVDLASEGSTKSAASADGTDDDGRESADGGAPTTEGDSGTDAGEADDSGGSTGDDTPVPGAGSGASPDGSVSEGETDLTAVAFIDDLELERPQTYRVEMVVLGRQDAGGGLVYAKAETAELLGPIDAGTGEPMGAPDPDEPDHARRIETLTILATATEAALSDMEVGRTETVYLILLPAPGGGATLHVDRVL
jgi:hypothetical protein